MNRFHKLLTVATAVAAFAPLVASAQNSVTYNGNGAGGFGGPIGMGTLNFTSSGTTITGTITIGGNLAFNDDLVIYLDAQSGGFTGTSGLTDTGGGNDELRQATSGLSADGNTRAALNFGSGFGADYALAISPGKAKFASFYTLNSSSNFTYGSNGSNGNLNITPNNTNNGNGTYTYTFSFDESLLGGATSFNFLSTYLNGHDAYRSNETFGNTIVDTSNSGNPTTGSGTAGAGSAYYNLGSDTGFLDSVQTFNAVPEPGTWLAGGLLVVAAGWTVSRSRRSVA